MLYNNVTIFLTDSEKEHIEYAINTPRGIEHGKINNINFLSLINFKKDYLTQIANGHFKIINSILKEYNNFTHEEQCLVKYLLKDKMEPFFPNLVIYKRAKFSIDIEQLVNSLIDLNYKEENIDIRILQKNRGDLVADSIHEQNLRSLNEWKKNYVGMIEFDEVF